MHSAIPGAQPDRDADLEVVLVEDHAGYRDQLHALLDAIEDVRVVHVAEDEPAALRWLADHPHDWQLLVLDIFLAEGHGFNVLRACAQRGDAQRAVMLTSYTRDPARRQALALGANAVFDKALELREFLAYVAQLRRERRGLAARSPA